MLKGQPPADRGADPASQTISRRVLLNGTGAAVATGMAGRGMGALARSEPSGTGDANLLAGDGAAERAYLVDVLQTIAEPVLGALADGQLHERMPVHDWERHRADVTHLEACARTLAGIAPWLELGPDDSEEGMRREGFIDLARRSLVNATDPASPDRMTFDGSKGNQALVEAAYLGSAIMSAPTQLWAPLTDGQKQDVVEALQDNRKVEHTNNNNWWLFPAMAEAALWDVGADFDIGPIEFAVERIESWYFGDGIYGDGPDFRWDYYNSYVIHPMLLQVLSIAGQHDHPLARESMPRAMERAGRYAEVLERLISPEGTFPVIGRSSAYRFASMYHLAYMSLHSRLPETLYPGAVRSAITRVVRNMYEAPGTFDDDGWLQLGAIGHQPGLREIYNSTGALYVCLTGLVHLGLPANDRFWTIFGADWTQRRIWSGQDEEKDQYL